MLQEPMMEKMTAMRLLGMVDALKAQEQDPASRELSFLERLGLLVDQQWNWRENQALGRRLKNAKLRTNACVEDIDYRGARGLDKSVIRALVQASWLAPWHKKPAATGTPHFTPAPRHYSATWRWRVLMAASAIYWCGLAASTFW